MYGLYKVNNFVKQERLKYGLYKVNNIVKQERLKLTTLLSRKG